MNKTIILEGVNGSGKSTLGLELAARSDLKMIHAGSRPTHEVGLERSNTEVLEAIVPSIRDRCNSISHLVYHDDIPLGMMLQFARDIDEILQNSIIVYCVGRGVNTPKDYYTEEHKKEIKDNHERYRYRYASIMSAIPHIEYDFNEMSVTDLIAQFPLEQGATNE